jgi:hypothetical protein
VGQTRVTRSLIVVALTVACALALAATAAAAPSVPEIEALLAEYGSPMQGAGATFAAEGLEHGVDPAFLVAVAGAESTFGRFLYAPDGDEATFNAFNWFYADRRQDSDFGSWDEAIGAVAAGIAGHLYHGDGLVSIYQIAPRYCPEGTDIWLGNVAAFMARLGGDPMDTRYWGDGPPSTAPELLLVDGRVKLDGGRHVVGREVVARFTITNNGGAAVQLEGLRLVVRGPQGTRHDLGARESFVLAPGDSRRLVAAWPLGLTGRWDGWIEVDLGAQANLIGPSQAFSFESRLPRAVALRRSESQELRLAQRGRG